MRHRSHDLIEVLMTCEEDVHIELIEDRIEYVELAVVDVAVIRNVHWIVAIHQFVSDCNHPWSNCSVYLGEVVC